MKIAILGYSGSGKSTLARKLADYYKIPVLFLDTVQFLPNWVERDRNEGRSIVKNFMKNDAWVIDGNYNVFFQAERLEQADTIIFMNFSRFNCLYRALKRYAKNKNITRESMANGCIEKMDWEFIWWILYKGRTSAKQKHYAEIELKYSDKMVVVKNQKQLDNIILRVQKPKFTK